uniref:Gp3 n=1 Tax=Sclerotinia sclerotiorum negative-stranded RNA virus 3-U TaxID=2879908 RepID=A0A8K1YSE8_9VIRU|nr:hypothetical protein [Sclerotinia sclerotiorum negative-stranded RNA virus 3-U]
MSTLLDNCQDISILCKFSSSIELQVTVSGELDRLQEQINATTSLHRTLDKKIGFFQNALILNMQDKTELSWEILAKLLVETKLRVCMCPSKGHYLLSIKSSPFSVTLALDKSKEDIPGLYVFLNNKYGLHMSDSGSLGSGSTSLTEPDVIIFRIRKSPPSEIIPNRDFFSRAISQGMIDAISIDRPSFQWEKFRVEDRLNTNHRYLSESIICDQAEFIRRDICTAPTDGREYRINHTRYDITCTAIASANTAYPNTLNYYINNLYVCHG